MEKLRLTSLRHLLAIHVIGVEGRQTAAGERRQNDVVVVHQIPLKIPYIVRIAVVDEGEGEESVLLLE